MNPDRGPGFTLGWLRTARPADNPRAPRMLPLLLALVAGAQATDVEVGRARRFGVGIAAGYPPSATIKAFVDPRNAVAFHLGTTLGTSGLHLRLQFEQTAKELRRWDFGELGLLWSAGVVADFIFGQQSASAAVRPGLTAGVGVELRLAPVPVAVFGEAAPILYPFDLASQEETPFFPLGFTLVVGGRWYF